MLVRRVTCLFAATLLVGFASVATAEQGLPENAMLSAMGLSSIEVMSDSESMTIRGRGYGGYGYETPSRPVAKAYGSSYAKIAGQGAKAGSKNSYYAEGYHHAYGANGSIAVLIVKKYKGKGGGHGDYRPKRGGDKNWGGGGGGGGGLGGGGGGGDYPRPPKHKPSYKKVIAFAGGFSFAHAK
jgi:hypothetical protein